MQQIAQTATFKEVVANLEKKIERDPYNKKYISSLGEIYFDHDQYLKAADIFAKFLTIDRYFLPTIVLRYEKTLQAKPKNMELRKALINLHIAENAIPDALLEISDYLDLLPMDSEIISLLLKLVRKHKELNLDIVVEVLEKARRNNLRNSSLVEVLAGIYLDKQDNYNAIRLYEEAIAFDENNIAAWLILADLYVKHGNYQKAIIAYQRVLNSSGRPEQLVDKLEQLVKSIEDNIGFNYLLADAYLKKRDPDKAMDCYRLALKKKKEDAEIIVKKIKDVFRAYPDYPEAYFVLSKALLAAGRYSEAVTVLNKMVHLSHKYIDRVILELKALLKICPEQALAIQSLGEIYLLLSDYDNALKYFNQLVELMPEDSEKIVQKARDILKKDPRVVGAREIIARAFLSRGNYRRAAAEAESIIALDQKNIGAYQILGRAQLELGEIDLAATTLKMALSLDPYNKDTHYYYQKAAESRLDAINAALFKKIAHDPCKYSLHYELANNYFHKGLIKEAVGEFQLAVKDAEKAYDVHKMLGICFKEQGRYDLAVEQFNKSLLLLTESDVAKRLRIQFYIGLAYEAQGLIKEALSIYEEIMVDDINYENIQLRMEKLRSFSWVEIRGRALAAIIYDLPNKKIICSWAKNSESEEYNKKYKNKNVDLSFSLEHNNKAVEHALRGRFSAAEDELLLSEQMDPNFTIIHNNYGVINLIKGEYVKAKECFDRALSINKKLPIVFYNLGIYEHLQGNYAEAMAFYEKSLALDNSMYVVQINMGDIFYSNGEIEKAVSCWERVLQLGVVPELARRRLKYKQLA